MTIKKDKILGAHACGFNDGIHVCDCFVEGRNAGKLEERRLILDKIEALGTHCIEAYDCECLLLEEVKQILKSIK